MEEWKYVGLVAETIDGVDKSCSVVAKRMSKDIPNFNSAHIQNSHDTSLLLKDMRSALSHFKGGRILATNGHGRFHHFTYGLCRIADYISNRYCYVHIDHHWDSARYRENNNTNEIGCGSFVPYIMDNTHAESVVFLGVDVKNRSMSLLYDNQAREINNSCDSIAEMVDGEFDFEDLERLVSSIKQDDVYVTIDLDVMNFKEVITGYDRGNLSRVGLFEALKLIREYKRIIGADITGYSSDNEDLERSVCIDIRKSGYFVETVEKKSCIERTMQLYLELAGFLTRF